jgi:hypothetical protein
MRALKPIVLGIILLLVCCNVHLQTKEEIEAKKNIKKNVRKALLNL